MARYKVLTGSVNLGKGKVAIAGDIIDAPESMGKASTLQRISDGPDVRVEAQGIVAKEAPPVDHEFKRRLKK